MAIFEKKIGTNNPFDGVDVGDKIVPSFADLDGDGDLDAFIGELDGNLNFYRNESGTFAEVTGADNPFNGVNVGGNSAPSFADLDGDGDLDALIGDLGGNLNFYRNDSGTFTKVTGADNPFNGLNVGLNSAPSFADLDGDGDLDALIGELDGNLNFYRNDSGTFAEVTGADNPFDGVDVGDQSVPSFADLDRDGDVDAFIGEKDGNLNFYRNEGGIFTEVTGADNPFNGVDVGSYSAPSFADLDGDGDLDALIGKRNGTLNFYENTAPVATIAPGTIPSEVGTTATTGTFVITLTEAAPAGGIAIPYTVGGTATSGTDYTALSGTVTVAAGATTATIDITPILDTVVDPGETVEVTLTATPTSNYNLGDTATAVLRIADETPTTFTERTGTNNPFDGVDMGRRSTPSFADLDGDGDLDAVIGEFDQNLNFYRNEGGTFTEVTGADNPFNSVNLVSRWGAPSFADVDGDGDLDAVIGAGDGTLNFYRNQGGTFTEVTGTDNPFNGVNVGDRSAPSFADVDGDGDLDAVIGAGDGTLNFYRNEGGTFTQVTGTDNPFNGVDVGHRSAPSFADLDGDGDLDALIGNGDGTFNFYRNQGGTFTEVTGADNPFNGVDMGVFSTPSFADLDGDGDLDALIGNGDGTLKFYENAPTATVAAGITPTEDGTTGTFVVTLSDAAPDSGIVLDYTVAGTATDSTDYTTLSGTVTVAAGETTATVDVAAIDDASIDPGETVTVTLTDGTAYNLGTTTTAELTITDNDAAGFTLSKTTATVDESGSTDSFTVVLDAQPTSDVVILVSSDDTGEATATPTPLTFTPANWDTAQTVTVTGIDDNLIDGNANTTVTLEIDDANSDNNFDALGNQTVTVTTIDDGKIAASIAPGTIPSEVGTTATTGTFVVTLSEAAPTGGTTISYTVGGTATSGTDYTPLSGTVTVAAGATAATINITPILDAVTDPSETVEVTLTATPASDYNLGDTATAVLRIADNISTTFTEVTGADNPFNGVSGVPTFADIDGDGDLDAFIGEKDGNLNFYRNESGTFTEVTGADNPFNGVSAIPTFTDLDGDGDVDAFFSGEDGSLNFYRNESGTFTEVTGADNPFNEIDESGIPTFADADGDGDLDAFIGEKSGNLKFYRNESGTFTEVTGADNPFSGVTGSAIPIAVFADIDGDGDVDAFFLGEDGNLNFYRNESGTLTEVTGADNPLNGVTGLPTFDDIDGDGDLDAFISGEKGGNLKFYRNEGGTFTEVTGADNPFSGVSGSAVPTFIDIDEDGDVDAFFGGLAGFFQFYENAPTVTVTANTIASEDGTPGTFAFILNEAAPDSGITLNYTIGGTATAGSDYTPLSGTITVAAGETMATVDVVAIDDGAIEPGETVVITLTDGTAYNLGTTISAEVAIADNDAAGVTLSTTTLDVTEGGTTADYAVRLNSQPTGVVTLSFNTGTQLEAIDDFTFTPTNWNIPQTVTVSAIDDLAIEGEHGGSISHTLVGGGYDGINVGEIAITLTDNDIAENESQEEAINPETPISGDSILVEETETPTTIPTSPQIDTEQIPLSSAAPEPLVESIEPDICHLVTNPPSFPNLNPTTNTLTGTFLVGDNNDNTLNGTGETQVTIMAWHGDDNLLGSPGDDRMFANRGTDIIDAGMGNDAVFAGQGDDAARGGLGSDLIAGDFGNDRLWGDEDDDIIFGNAGNDYINGGVGNDRIFAGKDNDVAVGGDGADVLAGEMGSDCLHGQAGNDILFGNTENDVLDGGQGNDLLFGGRDNDTLLGGLGSDLLFGDLGNDLLTGGAGGDRFDFRFGDGSDIITDFEDGIDLIGLQEGLTFTDFAIAQVGNDTQITATGLVITLQGVDSGAIDSADFALI